MLNFNLLFPDRFCICLKDLSSLLGMTTMTMER